MESSTQLNAQIAYAWQHSELVQIGLAQSWAYHQAVHYEQTYLLNQINQTNPGDIAYLQDSVLARIENDLAITDKLNDLIAYSEFYTNASLTYPLKTNKMHEALTGAKSLVENSEAFEAIVTGHFPEGFCYEPTFLPFLGVVEGGDSSQTYLSTALIEILATLQNGNIHTVNEALNPQWLNASAVVHITQVNDAVFDIEPSTKEAFLNDYTFSISDKDTSLGLATVHNGYAFGGAREDTRYEHKWFAPEDCSSWIGKLAGLDIEVSTADMLNAYRVLSGQDEYVGAYWYKTPQALMLDKFTPVMAYEPSDLKPGQIMVMRKFANDTHHDLGIGGHTGLVVGVIDDQVLVLNYGRDMPKTEGFGLSLLNFYSDDNKEVFFLEAKEPLSIEDVIIPDQSQAFWQQTGLTELELHPSSVHIEHALMASLEQPLEWVI